MHGKDAARNKLAVLPYAEMPRLYPHHVVKHELQVQPALHTHLGSTESTHETVVEETGEGKTERPDLLK